MKNIKANAIGINANKMKPKKYPMCKSKKCKSKGNGLFVRTRGKDQVFCLPCLRED